MIYKPGLWRHCLRGGKKDPFYQVYNLTPMISRSTRPKRSGHFDHCLDPIKSNEVAVIFVKEKQTPLYRLLFTTIFFKYLSTTYANARRKKVVGPTYEACRSVTKNDRTKNNASVGADCLNHSYHVLEQDQWISPRALKKSPRKKTTQITYLLHAGQFWHQWANCQRYWFQYVHFSESKCPTAIIQRQR